MQREYVGSFKSSGISPKLDYQVDLPKLKTIGLKLSKKEAEELRDKLNQALNKSNDWEFLNLTGYRKNNQVTLTYYQPK